MSTLTTLPERPSHRTYDVRPAIDEVLVGLRAATELDDAETALSAVADILDMPFAHWVPDTSHPYETPRNDAYARSRGWPDELITLWWDRHAQLKMPFYIRCRFEHLPFVVSLDHKPHRDVSPRSAGEGRITTLIREMGVRSLLVVPMHLSKGQVAMVVWAGKQDARSVREMVADLDGELLAVGHHFMRIASKTLGAPIQKQDELCRLTPREWDCVRTLAQGYREAEIAELIGIKQVTVRFHLDNIVHKFGCKTRTQAVALLAQLGLLGPIGT